MTTNSEINSVDNDKVPVAKTTAAPENLGMENLAKVRDILFGSQMRAYDKRMTRLEERLTKEMAQLKEDTRERLASVELFAKRETEALLERLKSEQGERTGGLRDLRREIEKTVDAFGEQTAQLGEQLAKSERLLNQHILEQANGLRDQMQEKHSALEQALEQHLEALRNNTADRAELGSYLMEMGLRLRGELELPDIE